MNEPNNRVAPFAVSYSGRVLAELKGLGELAKLRGFGREFNAALKEIDRRLRLYPQFGQPLMNLTRKPLQIWIGVVPPLVVKYVLDEENRAVMVLIPLAQLPNSGF